jgi:colanic acid/amylovoran biosynthesis glycosyltransferase
MSIKLVYIIGSYPGLTNTFIDREVQTLRQFGYRIHIVSIRKPPVITSFSTDQKALYQETSYLIPDSWMQFNYRAFIFANFYMIFLKPRIYFGLLAALLIASQSLYSKTRTILHFFEGVYAAYLLRSEDFDHLHAHFIDRAALIAFIVSRFLEKPYSLTAHAADIYTETNLISEKLVNASFVVTVSDYNREHLLQLCPKLSPANVHVLHPWIDLTRFVPPVGRNLHAKLNILSVGRLVEKKGHLDLIEACWQVQKNGIKLECRIVGEGPLRSELEARINRYQLQELVFLLGAQPQSIVLELLASWADVFALPCVIARDGDRDGMPVALAEAMAMELPVISSDIVGIRELVRPGTGFLVPPNSPAALYETIALIDRMDPMARLDMGRQGRLVVAKEFNLHTGINQLAKLFSQPNYESYMLEVIRDLE